jgi:hypothetical protein
LTSIGITEQEFHSGHMIKIKFKSGLLLLFLIDLKAGWRWRGFLPKGE